MMQRVTAIQLGVIALLVGLCVAGMEKYVAYLAILCYIPLAFTAFSLHNVVKGWDQFRLSMLAIKHTIENPNEDLAFKRKAWYTYERLETVEFGPTLFWRTFGCSMVIYATFLYAAFRVEGLLTVATFIVATLGIMMLGVGVEMRTRTLRVMRAVNVRGAAHAAGLF